MFNACSQRPLRTRYWGTPASFDKDTRGVVKLGAQASTKPQRSLNEASTKPQRSFNEIDTCCKSLSLTPVYRTHSTGNKHALPMFHVLNIIIACVAHATRPVGHRPAHRVAFGMNVADVLLPCCSSHRTSGGPTNWYGSLFSYKPLSPNTYTICGTHSFNAIQRAPFNLGTPIKHRSTGAAIAWTEANCMVLHALIRLVHPHHRHPRRLPGRRRRRRLLIASSALATATSPPPSPTLTASAGAPLASSASTMCVWPTAAACSRAVPPRKPS